MAIHTGTTDFKLSVVKTGTKSLRIKWDRKTTGLTKVLQVFRPGDGKMIYTKSFGTNTHSGDVTVEVPFFGEYYVKMHISQGSVMWDGVKRWVKLSSSYTRTHTYTAEDVKKYKRDKFIITTLFAAAGLSINTKVAVASTIISFAASTSDIFSHDTKNESILAPREGNKLRIKIESATNGVKYSHITLNKNNVVLQTKSRVAKYIAY